MGFSIQYSQGVVGIIQQFVMNYSDLEMQLISIERLREYAREDREEEGGDDIPDDPFLLADITNAASLAAVPAELSYPAGRRNMIRGILV